MKNNFMRFIYLIFFIFNFFYIFLYSKEEAVSGDNVTINGNITDIQLNIHKELLKIDINERDVFRDVLLVPKEILNQTPRMLKDPSLITPSIIYSFNVISPFSLNILSSPFLKFDIEGSGVDIDEWSFIFTDPRGEVFSTISGKKNIPKELYWDGTSNIYKSLIIPGQSYSYILKVKKGNETKTIKGDYFSIKGIYFEKPEYKDIRLSLNEIFDLNTNSGVMKPTANLILKEAMDILKEFYDCNMNIIVYDKNSNVAQKRADILKKYIKTNMYTDDIQIVSIGKQVYISDYRIDIVISNKNKTKRKRNTN